MNFNARRIGGGLAVVVVDDEDGHLIAEKKLRIDSEGYPFFIEITQGRRVHRRLHRYIMGVTDESIFVDHRDTEKLNNTRLNLRSCSNTQNLCNRGKNKNNKSGFKGVHFHAKNGNWVAQIGVDKKKLHIGSYSTPDAAHAAYVEAAKVHHKEFARGE